MPIITISRGSLSGGRAVAQCLGERLGLEVLGREVLQEAASAVGVSPEDLQGKFETTPGLWARLTKDRERYFVAVQAALAERCLGGNLVYHGLAGQFLLRGLPGVLKVLIVAPLEMRIRLLLETQPRMTRPQVEEFIRKVDQERSRWVRVMYGAQVDDPFHYDLVVNLRSLSKETACHTIGEAAAQPHFLFTDDVKASFVTFAATCRERLARILGG